MRPKTTGQGADDGEVDFDDMPGEVGGENIMLDNEWH